MLKENTKVPSIYTLSLSKKIIKFLAYLSVLYLIGEIIVFFTLGKPVYLKRIECGSYDFDINGISEALSCFIGQILVILPFFYLFIFIQRKMKNFAGFL